jgi:hypothetical protein
MSYAENESKFTFVLNPKIKIPRVMNALAHLSIGLMEKAQTREPIEFLDYKFNSDRLEPSAISLYPFIILQAKNNNQLKTLHLAANETGILHNVFTETMLGASSIEQMTNTKNANSEDLVYFGIVLFGNSEKLSDLTRKFSVFSG